MELSLQVVCLEIVSEHCCKCSQPLVPLIVMAIVGVLSSSSYVMDPNAWLDACSMRTILPELICNTECILLSKISSRTRFLDFSDLTPSVAFSRYNVDIPVSHIHECFQEDDRLIVIVESLSVNCSRIGENWGAVGRSSRSVNGELCLIPGGWSCGVFSQHWLSSLIRADWSVVISLMRWPVKAGHLGLLHPLKLLASWHNPLVSRPADITHALDDDCSAMLRWQLHDRYWFIVSTHGGCIMHLSSESFKTNRTLKAHRPHRQ